MNSPSNTAYNPGDQLATAPTGGRLGEPALPGDAISAEDYAGLFMTVALALRNGRLGLPVGRHRQLYLGLALESFGQGEPAGVYEPDKWLGWLGPAWRRPYLDAMLADWIREGWIAVDVKGGVLEGKFRLAPDRLPGWQVATNTDAASGPLFDLSNGPRLDSALAETSQESAVILQRRRNFTARNAVILQREGVMALQDHQKPQESGRCNFTAPREQLATTTKNKREVEASCLRSLRTVTVGEAGDRTEEAIEWLQSIDSADELHARPEWAWEWTALAQREPEYILSKLRAKLGRALNRGKKLDSPLAWLAVHARINGKFQSVPKVRGTR